MTAPSMLHRVEDSRPYRWLKYRLNAKLVDFFDRHVLGGRRGLRVAEMACGSGYGAHLLAGHPAVVRSVAVDRDAALHDQAAVPGFAAEFVAADLLDLPFPPEQFDFVWNSSSVEHFPDPAAAIGAMADATKPGGFVFVGVPYAWGLLAVYFIVPSRTHREWLGRPFTFNRLENLFRACGLEPERRLIYFFGSFAGVLGRKVKSRAARSPTS